MHYVFESTGQHVEVPLLPGLTPRGDQWYARASRGGFNKAQVLEQEWQTGRPRTSSAYGSPRKPSREAALEGAGARPTAAAGDLALSTSPRPPSQGSTRSRGRPTTATQHYNARVAAAADDSPPMSETRAAFGADAVRDVERPGVLRFAAYFTQAAVFAGGASGAPPQVRKCFILYHLEDDTVEVAEERSVNSGIAGGRFYNRAPPSQAGGGWRADPPASLGFGPSGGDAAGPDRLAVGGELHFLGQRFQLVDADGFTRDWYAAVLGVRQPDAVGWPAGAPQEYHAEHATGLNARPGLASGRATGASVPRKSVDVVAKKSQMSKERQFFSHDVSEVLKFEAAWDDEAPGGQRHLFTLSFFLADNCAEITMVPQPGYDPFRHLLARQPLPLNWDAAQLGAAARFAAVDDLVIGMEITVYNRKLRLFDCSEFTRQWYVKHLRLEQPPRIELDAKGANASPRGAAFSTKSHGKKSLIHGFYRPEDGIDDGASGGFIVGEDDGGVAGRRAGQPRDLAREARVANKQIRVRLELCDRGGSPKLLTAQHGAQSVLNPPEPPRTFILTYRLDDDSLAIYEEHVQNSGVLGGTFLKRGHYKTLPMNGGPPRNFVPADFFTGNILAFSQHNLMRVVEVDGASLKTMADFSNEFPFSDAQKVLQKVLATLRASAPLNLRAALGNETANDSVCPGCMPEAAFKARIDQIGATAALNAQEKITLATTFRAPAAGTAFFTDVRRLCDTLAFQHISTTMRADFGDDASLDASLSAQQPGPDLVAFLAHVPVLLRKSLEAAAGPRASLAPREFERVLASAGVQLTADHVSLLSQRYGEPVHFQKLCDDVYACNFCQ